MFKIKKESYTYESRERSWIDCQENNLDGFYTVTKTDYKYNIYFKNKKIKSFTDKYEAKQFIKQRCSIKGINNYVNMCNNNCKKDILKLVKIIKSNEIKRKRFKQQLKRFIE